MARDFRLLSGLLLVSACLASLAPAAGEPTQPPTTAAPTTAAQTTAAPTTAAQTTAAQTTAAQTTAAQTTAAQTTAAQTTAAQTTAAQTTAAQTTAAQTTAAQTTAAQTTAAPTTAAQTTAAQTTAAQTTAAQTTAAQTTAAQTTAAQTTAAQTTAAQTTAAQTTAAQTTAAQTTAAQTTAAPTTAAQTTAAPTTQAPGTGNTTPGPTTDPPTPKPTLPDPCKPDPCRDSSTCEPRFDGFVCLCPTGKAYVETTQTCEDARVFFGQLTLPNIDYDANLEDPTSEKFKTESAKVTEELKKAFETTPGYIESVVLKFTKTESSTVRFRAETGVVAEVENIFDLTTAHTDAEINTAVAKYIDSAAAGSALGGGTVTALELCDRASCDGTSTECKSEAGTFTCPCKEGYNPTTMSSSICIACPSGEQSKDGKCVACPFGRSGFNCNESWELILVIVGSLLGALLLGSVIALAVIASKPKKKKSKNKNKDENTTSFSAKAPLVSNSTANSRVTPVNGAANAYASSGVPRIPRATTTNSMDHRTNLEMTPSNSRQNMGLAGRNPRLYEDPDDFNRYAQTRPQSNNYPASRPQNNPYAATRPQSNPYASNQGYANPYYKHDNGRPLY